MCVALNVNEVAIMFMDFFYSSLAYKEPPDNLGQDKQLGLHHVAWSLYHVA